MRVNWAVDTSQPGDSRKQETSRHFHVFVGNLSSEVDSTKLGGERRDRGNPGELRQYEKTFDEVYNQTSADKTSVYVGQINQLTEDEIRRAFDRFGPINEIRMF
ncbi:unnamed protein product [Caenorhabditis nigoni]